MEKLASYLRGLVRLILVSIVILSFLIWSYICHFLIRDLARRRKAFSSNTKFFSSLFLKILRVNLSTKNLPCAEQKFLLVSNHLGFLDILMICSMMPTLFVTSIEMKETPFLGILTEMGGCIYVERRSRTKILDELGSIVEALKLGFRVTLYPEAASTNGEQVLPFKKTLIMAAPQAGVPIQPMVVNFRKINDEDFTTKWRDHVCWYGDTSFITAGWKTLTLKSVEAEIEFLEQVWTQPEDDRTLVATRVHAMIAQKYVPVKAEPAEVTESGPLGIDPT